jgi:hypothetical protein
MEGTMPPGGGKLKRSIGTPKENRLADRHRDEGDEGDEGDMNGFIRRKFVYPVA